MASHRPVRERLWPFLGLAAIATALFVGYLMRLGRETDALVAVEDGARDALVALVDAQRTFHAREGRFASVDDLVAARALPNQVKHVAREGDEPSHLSLEGYRVDVLLPVRQTPDGQIWILPEGGEARPHPGLLEAHVAMVARPLEVGVTGWRVFYTDESGVLWASDMVSDESARRVNPLPLRHLSTGEATWDGPLSWTPLAEIDARNERDK